MESNLRRAITISEAVEHLCFGGNDAPPLVTSGLRPNLQLPAQGWMVPKDLITRIGNETAQNIWARTKHLLSICRQETLDAFLEAIQSTLSVECVGGTSDYEVERQLCYCFEEAFRRRCDNFRNTVRRGVERGLISSEEASRKASSSSFSPYTITVLEAAYTRCTTLTSAETNIIAQAAKITPHQVRTWFQNKRNRGKKGPARLAAPVPVPNRQVSSLPKRAQLAQQQQPPATQLKFDSPLSPRRNVRSLPRRAQQSSHNAPQRSIVDSSLGTYALEHADESQSSSSTQGLQRLNRSPSLVSSASSDVAPNGGFISPYDMHLATATENNVQSSAQDTSYNDGQQQALAQGMPQIAVEWGTGMLNVPIEALGGGQAPIFNFTPPSPLNMDFNPIFNPAAHAHSGTVESPIDVGVDSSNQLFSQFNFNFDASQLSLDLNLDMAGGLESIESLLTEALSDPTSFEKFSTLAASPQISLDSLSPRSDSIDSITSLPSGNITPSLGQEYGLGTFDEGLNGDFFNALEGLLASPSHSVGGSPNNGTESGSPVVLNNRPKWNTGPSQDKGVSRSTSFASEASGSGWIDGNSDQNMSVSMEEVGNWGSASGEAIISAPEGIDVSYIASIPLPPSPTTSSLSLPNMDDMGDYFAQPLSASSSSSSSHPRSSHAQAPSQPHAQSQSRSQYQSANTERNNDLQVQISSLTPARSISPSASPMHSVHSGYVSPGADMDKEMAEWEWSGVLPFDMVGMEVDFVDMGSMDGSEGLDLGTENGIGGMWGREGMVV